MEYDFRISTLDDERAYHNTAILIYLKAARDIMGNVNVTIGNSLNQGYFTYIEKGGAPLTSTDIHKIWNRMEHIVSRDYPIVKEFDTVEHAAEKWRTLGYKEKAGLLEERDPSEKVEILNLDGYRNCLYSRVLPSTGYITLFELRPYRQGLLLRLPNVLSPDSLPYYRDDDKLYDAYAESKRMRRETGINYLADMNRVIRSGEIESVIKASEELHQNEIDEFADMIVSRGKRIVLIAGPSSSGKTTTAKRLCKALAERTAEPLYLGTDDYYINRDLTPLGPDGKPDFESFDAIDMMLFNKQMTDLLAGREADIPEYNFVEGKKIFGNRITSIEPDQIIVIEGIHSLNDALTPSIDPADKFKIFISPLTQMGMDRHNRLSTADTRLLRRMVRDNQFRGYSAEKTLLTWYKVRAGESVNVFPYSSSADVVFNSSTVYETNLLRTYAEPILQEIHPGSEAYPEAQRILNFIKYFDKIETPELVPDYSILREFIGFDK
ncbi:MAG: nucleoside kinase [Mogibacterium sp.]|nr:nucleoside kinase [Mogibacterium sp.]